MRERTPDASSAYCDIFAGGCATADGRLEPLADPLRTERRTIFGENLIHIHEKSVLRLLLDEVGSWRYRSPPGAAAPDALTDDATRRRPLPTRASR